MQFKEEVTVSQPYQILIQAINDYSGFCDKEALLVKERSFIGNLFSFLAPTHTKKEGETLKALLRSSLNPLVDPTQVLQNYFNKHSNIDDENSLETYLCKAIFKHSAWFLMAPRIGDGETKPGRRALRDIILKQQVFSPGEYAHQLAKLYEADSSLEAHTKKAFSFHTLAIRHQHVASLKHMKTLALKGDANAQYVIGFEYYHRQNQVGEAIEWCMKAAEQRHLQARAYLFETQFEANYYFLIGQRYDEGKNVKQDLTAALHFYQKAYRLRDVKASFRLGELYELEEEKEVKGEAEKVTGLMPPPNILRALDCYEVAAKKGHRAALSKMQKMTQAYPQENVLFKTAQAQLIGFADYMASLPILKNLSDKSYAPAIAALDTWAKNNTAYAFSIGKLYEEESSTPRLIKACYYYILSAQGDTQGSKSQLATERLAQLMTSDQFSPQELTRIGQFYLKGSDQVVQNFLQAKQWFEKAYERGCAIAHYELGRMYQMGRGVELNRVKAAVLYQLANQQGHAEAGIQLNQLVSGEEMTASELMTLASSYQIGAEGITIDWPQAMQLYQKAVDLGDAQAAFYLGQSYQVDHVGVEKNILLAFQAYLRAAKLGHPDAFSALERLGEEVSADHQTSLSQCYASLFNQNKSDYWHQKAMEGNQVKLTG